MTAATLKAKRPAKRTPVRNGRVKAEKPKTVKRESAKERLEKMLSLCGSCPDFPTLEEIRGPEARVRTIHVDWSRSDAFLKLPLEERKRRTEAFRAALAPAFADYSSEDFRADQRREAERD